MLTFPPTIYIIMYHHLKKQIKSCINMTENILLHTGSHENLASASTGGISQGESRLETVLNLDASVGESFLNMTMKFQSISELFQLFLLNALNITRP